MYNNKYTIVVPSSESIHGNATYRHLCEQATEKSIIQKDGTGYLSFSKLINDSMLLTDTEIVIICSDKCRPNTKHINKTLDLLKEGYGIVGLYRFGFFGFTKQLIQKVGFFDENFIGGGYEDCDMQRRLKEANVAHYESEEIEYQIRASRWRYISKGYYDSKWKEDENSITRLVPEPVYDYNIGDWPERSFLKWKDSVLLPRNSINNQKLISPTTFDSRVYWIASIDRSKYENLEDTT